MRTQQDNIGFTQRYEIAEVTAPDGSQAGNEQFCHGSYAKDYTVRVSMSSRVDDVRLPDVQCGTQEEL